MANNYYTYTDTFTPGLKARSGDIDREYLAIQSAFDLLPATPDALSTGRATFAGTSAGAGNAYEVTMPNTRTSNTNGDEIVFFADKTNTGPATLAVDAIGAVPLRNWSGTALAGGEIVAGRIYLVRFDSANSRFVITASTDAALNKSYAEEWANAAYATLVSAAAGGNQVDDYSARHQADAAQDWAIRAEDDPVPTTSGGDGATEYSAFHWAQKASGASGLPLPSGALGLLHVNSLNNAWIQNNDFTLNDVTQQLLFPSVNSQATPALAFGNGDTGFFEASADVLQLSVAGTARWTLATNISSTNASGPRLLNSAPSSVTPSLIPNQSDTDTGIGWNTADELSLVAGGVEIMRLSTPGDSYAQTDFPFFIAERADDLASVSGYGQFWVRSSDGVPMFTNDADEQFELTAGGGGIMFDTWVFDSTVNVPQDPGAGELRFSSGVPSVTTGAYISDTTGTGLDPQELFESLAAGGFLIISNDDRSSFLRYVVSGVTDNTTWWQLTLDYRDGNNTLPANGEELQVQFFPSALVEDGEEVSSASDILYFEGSTSRWEATGAQLRVNPNTPPLGGRIQIGTTLSSATNQPAIAHEVGVSSQVLRFVHQDATLLTTTNGYYETAQFAGGTDFIEFGWRVSSLDYDMLYVDQSREYRFLSDMVWRLAEKTAPTTDVTGFGQLYINSVDAELYYRDEAGDVYNLLRELRATDHTLRFQALTSGIGALYADGNTDTEDHFLEFRRANEALRGRAGYLSTGNTLFLENQVHGGQVIIRAETAGGTGRNMLTLNPAGGITVLHNGATSFYTSADGINLDGSIYLDEVGAARDDVANYGQLWMLDTSPNQFWFTNDIGENYAVALGNPRQRLNGAANMATTSIARDLIGGVAMYNNSTSYTITLAANSNTSFPVSSSFQIFKRGTGTITINEGASTTLYYIESDGTVTDTAGGCTMQTGVATVYRESTTVYLIWGINITA